jgi:cytochrome c biogenesis protein
MLLGLASVPGSLVPQNRVDPLIVAQWQATHPGITPLYSRLGLFDVYSSPWFSAIYILLMISLIGCILPRVHVYWRAATAPPPPGPRYLVRLPSSLTGRSTALPAAVADSARRQLRSHRFRVRVETDDEYGTTTVSAQRGYLREAGNLIFHISVVVVLVAFAVGDLFGYKGAAVVISGDTFSNVRESYDDFAPGAYFRSGSLTPFALTLDRFKASFVTSGPSTGQPSAFEANVSYSPKPGAREVRSEVQVNHPLTIGNTSVFLIANGYAPVVTVRDGTGQVAYSGPTVFIPQNGQYMSSGAIKVPDAKPTQLGFDGDFLPTYAYSPQTGPFSAFPATLAPALSLTLYTGDLGLGSGIPQSIYSLTKAKLSIQRDASGKPLRLTIPLGTTVKLPDGLGTISFDSVKPWARFQFSSTPAEPFALLGVVLALIGLLGSLYIRPRRIWVRAHPSAGGSDVEVAGIDRREGRGLPEELARLLDRIAKDIR